MSGDPRYTPQGRRPTLAERAYDAIKQRIIVLDMAPGMPFTEGQLAAEMALSKTPVREALGWLQREGLVELTERSRYRVAPVTLKDVKDLFSLRILLEGEAVALAAGQVGNTTELQTLEELSQIGYDPHDRESIIAFLRANTAFHATVARIGGNRRLAATLEQVLDQSERLFHLGLAFTESSAENVRSHQELIRAIVRGDPGPARDLAVAHTRASQATVIDSLLSSDVLQSTNIPSVMTRRAGGGAR
jgi:DNA-binding GntR family transcriptional regulator